MPLHEKAFACLQGVNCWHDLDNTEYDCWPMNSPNDYNMISCGGKLLFFYLCVCLLELIFSRFMCEYLL